MLAGFHSLMFKTATTLASKVIACKSKYKKVSARNRGNCLHCLILRDMDTLYMKLTIIRLVKFTDQDHIDLAKVWPEYSPASLQVDETHHIYAARFNDRLLGAVRVTLLGAQGALDSLRIRDVTRRRGVGKYLLEEVMRENPNITTWWITEAGVEDRTVMAAFAQAMGFTAQNDGWVKR